MSQVNQFCFKLKYMQFTRCVQAEGGLINISTSKLLEEFYKIRVKS